MTLLEDARKGRITDEMRKVAREEGVTDEFVRRGMANGRGGGGNQLNTTPQIDTADVPASDALKRMSGYAPPRTAA